MFEQFEQIEHYFDVFVRACILLIEIAGIAVIVISMVRGFIGYVRKDESIRIDLAKGIMLGLEFKVGSEVLRSVIVSGWNELGTLAAVILLRSLLTFLLHWEIREEEKRCEALGLPIHGQKPHLLSGRACEASLPEKPKE
jgi:uncharacterized membrane protein